LEDLRLPQHFLETVGVKKVLLNVPTRKPGKQEFVRTHPDEAYRINLLTLELGGGDTRPELYLVHPDISGALEGEVRMVTMFTAISRQGVVFLWPVTIPSIDGRQMLWHSSMREAAQLAMDKWLRVKANMAAGCYDVYLAEKQDVEPAWPADLPTLHSLLELASKDGKLIDKFDHPAIKALRGG
jgi:hypothetical protein